MSYHALSLSLAEALLRSHDVKGTPGEPAPPRPPFSITISREAGALGHTVAEEVGRRLGWPVYDREVLDQIAAEMRRPSFHLEAVDERPVSWLEECLAGLVNEYHVSADAYLKYLLATVRGLGAVGHCVIVGRGANFILPAETTLRARLVAAPQDRARVLARCFDLPAAQAAARATAMERQRVEFIRRTFGQDPTDPHHYDLVLNLSRLSVEDAAAAITQQLQRFAGRASPAGSRQGSAAPPAQVGGPVPSPAVR